MSTPTLLSTVRDLERVRQIATVLARHGFGEVVVRTGLGTLISTVRRAEKPTRLRLAERMRLVLEDLGPSFVKLGQVLSTRPDLLPEDLVAELRKLQDDVSPAPFEDIRRVIEEELGAALDELFEDFAPTALASASVGQVHCAKLRVAGSAADELVDVVVKVQRPNARAQVEGDVDLLYWMARLAERTLPETRLWQPVKLVSEFERAIRAELDYVREAEHAERFARNFSEKPFARFPKVHRQVSARRVLTLERFVGPKVDGAVAEGHDGEAIAKAAVDVLVQQIFEDGFFHADPHPGNVFVLGTTERPVIGMIDLGLVGHLSPGLRDRTVDLMVAAVREDYRGLADALLAIGRTTKKVDRRAFEADVTLIAERYLGKALGEIELGALLRDLVDGARRYEIEIPASFLMMGKTLMTLEGVGKELHPELDIFAEVKPYFIRLIQQRYSPERLTQDALRGLTRLSNAASDLPIQMQEILEDLRQGALSIQIRETGLERATDVLGRRIFAGMVVASTVVGGTILLSADERLFGGTLLGGGLGYAFLHAIAARRRQR